MVQWLLCLRGVTSQAKKAVICFGKLWHFLSYSDVLLNTYPKSDYFPRAFLWEKCSLSHSKDKSARVLEVLGFMNNFESDGSPH
jgi:hypothetical protein